MNDTLSIVLTASAWAAGGGLAVWLVTMPLRRRSIVALLASIVLTGTVASVAAVIGSVHAMFLTTNELVVTVTWRSSPAWPPRSLPRPPADG